MLENIILLIGDAAVGQDEVILALIKQAKAFVVLYCGLSEYDKSYDVILTKMVIEDWNRRGSEGVQSISFGGLTQNFEESPYSPQIMSMLKKAGKGIRFL